MVRSNTPPLSFIMFVGYLLLHLFQNQNVVFKDKILFWPIAKNYYVHRFEEKIQLSRYIVTSYSIYAYLVKKGRHASRLYLLKHTAGDKKSQHVSYQVTIIARSQ